MNIEGKLAVITGGASGLGRATAEMIVANGGKVAILDLNEDLAKATAEEIGSASAYQVNVTDDASVTAAIEQIHADHPNCHRAHPVAEPNVWHQKSQESRTTP